MANDYRNESRRTPPLEKYGTPGTQYPTANPYDVVITEEVTNRAQVFEPVVMGTPHPTVTTALLCFQGPVKSGNTDKAPVRIYANPRLAQEPYNLINGDDDANDAAYPSFVRSYLLPRGYTKATLGANLKALIGLTLVAGGTGYGAALTDSPTNGKIALAFSGGAGSGAAGYAEVVGGIIVAVLLTNTGTGYTSVPTVSVSGGSGASITALLQPATALLTNEVETPAEDPFGGYFVRVTRNYETLPGKALTTTRQADESKDTVTTTVYRDLVANILTKEELTGSGPYVWSRWRKGEGDSVAAQQIIESRAVPSTLTDAWGYDKLRGPVRRQTQLIRAADVPNPPAPPTESGGTVTQIDYEDVPGSTDVKRKVIETYTLAGAAAAALTRPEYDKDSRTFIYHTRTLKKKSSISEGLTLNSGSDKTITLIEAEPVDLLMSVEVSTTWIEPVARSSGTQFVMGKTVKPFRFPNVITDAAKYFATDGVIGFCGKFVADVEHVQKAFWVFDDDDADGPDLPLDGVISYATLDRLFGIVLGDIITDEAGPFSLALGYNATINASVPDATTYLADWVDGDPRAVDGRVYDDGNAFRKRVEREYIVFIIQIATTYVHI